MEDPNKKEKINSVEETVQPETSGLESENAQPRIPKIEETEQTEILGGEDEPVRAETSGREDESARAEIPGEDHPSEIITDESEDVKHSPHGSRVFFGGLLTGLILAAAAVIIFSVLQNQTSKENIIDNLIKKEAITSATSSDLTEGKYKGILKALDDPYAAYYTTEETQNNAKAYKGSFEGIGIGIMQDETTKQMKVGYCYEDSPAQKAGVEVDDILISVDGEEVSSMTVDDLSDYLQLNEGETMTFVFQRQGTEYTVSITPGEVIPKVVTYSMEEDDIGYIQIQSFLETTSGQFESALSDLKAQGMKKLIIDLRNDPGGLISSVTDCLNQILPEGLEVYTVEKDGEKTEYNSDGKSPLTIPLVLIVNRNTASSAEIFTGACRDRLLATIVGEKTYGKGIVQTTITLYDGSSIKYTTAYYYSPNGTNINKEGFSPDIEVSLPEGATADASDMDAQYQKALEVIRDMN